MIGRGAWEGGCQTGVPDPEGTPVWYPGASLQKLFSDLSNQVSRAPVENPPDGAILGTKPLRLSFVMRSGEAGPHHKEIIYRRSRGDGRSRSASRRCATRLRVCRKWH